MNIKDKPIADFNNKKDFKLTKALKEALFIIFPTNKKTAFHIGFSINENDN